MLNLEEINMSEEELIRSYDPDNEENNYHLPHHLYKSLQLKQYRSICSEVVQRAVYISGYQVASNAETLRRHGITHVVNTAADVCPNHFTGEFNYLTFYLKDTNNEEIGLLFYKTLDYVHRAVCKGGRVLVHCKEGVSRSSTMVIAYLMWRFAITFEQAHEQIQKVRPICNPNTGFTCQLLVLAKKLGIGGTSQASTPSDKASVFRIAPHHANEPFLVLTPADWPSFDPRFAWVVQRGTSWVLWMGSQVVDEQAARAAVQQQIRWVLEFEKQQVCLSEVQDGHEPPHFWGLLGAPGSSASGPFAAPRSQYDADAEILGDRGYGCAATPPPADDSGAAAMPAPVA